MQRYRLHPLGAFDRESGRIVAASDPGLLAWLALGNELDPQARFEMRRVGVLDRELGREIRSVDPEWRAYEGALAAGAEFDPQPPEPAAPDPRFDPVLAGRAREARKLTRLAETDPATAALVAVGLKRRPRR